MKLGNLIKAGIGIIIVIAIIGLLYGTAIGRKFLGILEFGARKIISGLASLLRFPKKAENYFLMNLSADKESFYGQEFKVESSSSKIKGICLEVKLNDVVVDITECEISFLDGNGSIKYQNDTIQGSIAVSKAMINNLPFKQATLKFEIVPAEFSINGINEKEISISVKDGKLELFNQDGTSKCVIWLKNKITKIYDFTGSFNLKKGSPYLQGNAYFEESVCL